MRADPSPAGISPAEKSDNNSGVLAAMATNFSLDGLPRRSGFLACALLIAGCAPAPEETASTGAEMSAAPEAEMPVEEARNMRLLGLHDLQGRSAYQPVVHAYGNRRILFVGHHIGEAMNPMTGVTEVNGTSILDVTDPSAPRMLRHLPPNGAATFAQHVQLCDGADLPNGDPAKTYMLRTNGNLGWELYDATDPEELYYLRTVAETGYSSRPESSRGVRETHKMQWDCETGIGYFNGTPEGWRVTRLLMTYDLSNPEQPRHVRDFGLDGWQPDPEGEMPEYNISGLHQPFVVGNRMYLGYGSGGDGVLQILDRDKFLDGDSSAQDPYTPTTENLLYPQISRLDMPSYWGVHTAKPIYDFPIPDYADDRDYASRDLLIIVSEAGGGARRCLGTRDVSFIVDISQEDKPFVISTFQTDEEPGDFCGRGGRFGPHSVHDAYHPGFDKSMAVLSYFNAGIRAFDIRNPFEPVEIGYYVPQANENTIEACAVVDGVEECQIAIQTNNVNIDDRGLIYAVDRANTGLHIVELTGEAAAIVGL